MPGNPPLSRPDTDAALRPCPFCGQAPLAQPVYPGRRGATCWLVECVNPACAATVRVRAVSRGLAVASWNARAPSPVAYEAPWPMPPYRVTCGRNGARVQITMTEAEARERGLIA